MINVRIISWLFLVLMLLAAVLLAGSLAGCTRTMPRPALAQIRTDAIAARGHIESIIADTGPGGTATASIAESEREVAKWKAKYDNNEWLGWKAKRYLWIFGIIAALGVGMRFVATMGTGGIFTVLTWGSRVILGVFTLGMSWAERLMDNLWRRKQARTEQSGTVDGTAK